VRIPSLDEIRAARERLRGFAIRTPLIRWPEREVDLWLKLENLQPIGSFKIRGARNAMATAPASALAKGVYTASAGNMAQGVAWCAREMGIPCTVVVPDHAPATKLAAIDRLGAATVKVPFDRWWRVLEERRYDGLGGHFVHPVSDSAVIAGNATIGAEIAEDLPGAETVLVPFGGGGLACGIAAALRGLVPSARVWAVEPETASPFGASFEVGEPRAIDYRPSFVDGAGGRAVLEEMWPLARELLAGAVAVSLPEVVEGVRLLLERVRVVAEGAGALAVAAARSGRVSGRPLVCVISGGNIDGDRLTTILGGGVPS
jgi:threonine dehydratase